MASTEKSRNAPPVAPRILILMGVSGSGKSTIGAILARRLGWDLEDADWFHPASNVEKKGSSSVAMIFLFRKFLRTPESVDSTCSS